MPTVIIGAITYTVYSDVAMADDYYNGSTEFAAWNALTSEAKARGLVSATRLIDRQGWAGVKVVESPENELEFPRTGLTDCGGNAVTASESLALAVEASQLLALDTINSEEVTQKAGTENLTKRLKAGSVEVEYFRADTLVVGGARFDTDVMELIGCFFSGSAGALVGSSSFGTDGVSEDINFDLNSGF